MNRYSDYTPSAYDPMDFKDIAMVPMMKRQQHDANQAKLDAYLTEINKIDPLDVHQEEAMKIKSDLANKINQQSEQLAKEGFNNNTVPNVLKTNREIQDLFSPTGRAGQINQAKIIYNKEQEEFIKNAEAQKIGREQALKLWKDKTNTYNGYDLNREKIINVTPQGVAAFQDYGQDLSRAHSILGKTVEGISSAGHHLETDGNGGFWEVNQNNKTVKSDNAKQVEAAYKSFRDKWIDQNGEGTKYSKDAGLGIDETRILNDFNSMLENSNITDNSQTANYNVPSNSGEGSSKKEMFNDAIQDPSSIQNLDKDIHDVDFNEIGKINQNNYPIDPKDTDYNQKWMREQNAKRGKPNTYKDVLNPLQQRFYETAAKNLINKGRLSKNADINDPKNAAMIGFYMKNHMKFPTVANDIIRADVAIDNKLFTGSLASTDEKERNNTLEQDVRGDSDNPPLRKMIDSSTGEETKLQPGDKIDYLGVDSPINYRNYKFNNSQAQSVMAHRAHILDKDGNFKQSVVISRSPNEMNDPEFKKMQEINQIYKNGIDHLNEWRRPLSKYSNNPNLKKLKIKINDDNTFEIQPDGYESSGKLSPKDFMQEMIKHVNK